jgi:hypothetical protein
MIPKRIKILKFITFFADVRCPLQAGGPVAQYQAGDHVCCRHQVQFMIKGTVARHFCLFIPERIISGLRQSLVFKSSRVYSNIMRELAYKNKVDKCANWFSSFGLFPVSFMSPSLIGGGLRTIFSNPKDLTLHFRWKRRHIIFNLTLWSALTPTLPLNFITDDLPHDAE